MNGLTVTTVRTIGCEWYKLLRCESSAAQKWYLFSPYCEGAASEKTGEDDYWLTLTSGEGGKYEFREIIVNFKK